MADNRKHHLTNRRRDPDCCRQYHHADYNLRSRQKHDTDDYDWHDERHTRTILLLDVRRKEMTVPPIAHAK